MLHTGSKKVYSDEFKRKKEKQGAAEDVSAANSTHQQVCFEEVRKKKQDWHTQKDSNPDQPWTVPLSTVALKLLDGMRPVDAVTVFTLAPDSVTQAFKRAAVRARMGGDQLPRITS